MWSAVSRPWASHHRPGDKWAVLPIEVDTVCPDKHDRKWSLRPCELEVPQYQCITVSGGFVNHKSQAIINLDELSIPTQACDKWCRSVKPQTNERRDV